MSKLKKEITTYRYFFSIFLLIGLFIAGAITVFYNLEKKDHLSWIKIEEKTKTKMQAELINLNLKDIVSDLNFLSRQNELLYMIESGDKHYIDKYS
ncbi:MAG: hypothetical protein RBR53_11345 [Desulforegulaceae bacterium]|nr:hypothetical protein [Desulforegulaceae bacterium]